MYKNWVNINIYQYLIKTYDTKSNFLNRLNLYYKNLYNKICNIEFGFNQQI